MPKRIKEVLIHKIGGYTESEYKRYGVNRYKDGAKYNNANIKFYLQHLENISYGKSMQEWIDVIHNAIKHL